MAVEGRYINTSIQFNTIQSPPPPPSSPPPPPPPSSSRVLTPLNRYLGGRYINVRLHYIIERRLIYVPIRSIHVSVIHGDSMISQRNGQYSSRLKTPSKRSHCTL